MRYGVAVARIIRRKSGARKRRSVPETIRGSLSRLWRQRGPLGIRGIGVGNEAEQVALAPRALEGQDQCDSRAFQQRRYGTGHSPSADRQPAYGRDAYKRRHASFGRLCGSDDSQPDGTGNPATEHGFGLRTTHYRISRKQLLDGLQFAHFLGESGLPGSQRNLPFVGVRYAV